MTLCSVTLPSQVGKIPALPRSSVTVWKIDHAGLGMKNNRDTLGLQ